MAESPSELQLEIEKLERKHAENPEGRFFVPLANAYRKLGDLETAEALLQAGIERHPDYLSAHVVLGRCLADRGAVQEAEEEFRFVLSQDPQNLIALRTLGELAATEGRTTEAVDWYNELLAVDPMNEDARQALERLGSAPQATESEEEFRAGGGWWEAGEPEASGGVLTEEGNGDDEAPAEDPAFYGDISLDDEGAGLSSGFDEAEEVGEPAASRPEPVTEFQALDEEEPGDEAYGGTGASEVVTETIAELYARQGLHERAISVYRELIRRRGGDPVLERRLAEMEGLVGEERAGQELPELTLQDDEALETPAVDAERDAFADSVSEGFATTFAEGSWSAGEQEAGVTSPDPAEQELVAASIEGTAGATIAQFLTGLAAWRPGQGTSSPPSTASGQTATEEAPPFEDSSAYAEPAWEPEPAPEVSGTVDSWREPDAFQEIEPESGESEREGEQAAVEDLPYLEEVEQPWASAGTGSAEDEPFPWELPGVEPSEERQEPTPGAEQETLAEYRLDEAGPAPAEAEADLSEPSAPPAASRDDHEAGSASDPGEDEDLESFQAWLRSLKR